jgi:hypothetical protein
LGLIKLVHTIGAGSFKKLIDKFAATPGTALDWAALSAFWRATPKPLAKTGKLSQPDIGLKNVEKVISEPIRNKYGRTRSHKPRYTKRRSSSSPSGFGPTVTRRRKRGTRPACCRRPA